MDLSLRKEQFSYDYVSMVATAADCMVTMAPRSLDARGIDCTISATEEVEGIAYPSFDVQVKCTADDRGDGDQISYALDIGNYNSLRAENVWDPRVLIVVFVPNKVDDWLRHTNDELCVRYCGYWISLRGQPETDNTTSKTIHIPRQQVFSVDALREIMRRIAARQDL